MNPIQRAEFASLLLEIIRNDVDLRDQWICDIALVDAVKHGSSFYLGTTDSVAKGHTNKAMSEPTMLDIPRYCYKISHPVSNRRLTHFFYYCASVDSKVKPFPLSCAAARQILHEYLGAPRRSERLSKVSEAPPKNVGSNEKQLKLATTLGKRKSAPTKRSQQQTLPTAVLEKLNGMELELPSEHHESPMKGEDPAPGVHHLTTRPPDSAIALPCVSPVVSPGSEPSQIVGSTLFADAQEPTAALVNICEGENAEKVFRPEIGETVEFCLLRRIEFCEKQASSNVHSRLAFKYLALRRAYCAALEYYPRFETWHGCCKIAVQACRDMGIPTFSFKTLAKWNVYFRKHGTLAPSKKSRKNEPKLFSLYPESKELVHEYFSSNMETVTIEKFRDHMDKVVFPELMKKDNESRLSDNKPVLSRDEFLQSIGLSKFGMTTMYRYAKLLGYSYCSTKKSYYNDGHQKPEQVAYRKEFVKDYFETELRSYLWVQVPEDDAVAMESDSKDPLMKDIYHSFIDHSGQVMREYHVDSHPDFTKYIQQENLQYGGNLSVRRPVGERPTIIVGQDESAFSQYTFNQKMWRGPSGETKLLPKSLGETMMVSAFQSRVFGLGRSLSDDELAAINERRHGKEYVSKEAALLVKRTSLKRPLKSNAPFVRFFDVGVERDGYWDYNQMAIQTEDLLDCLVVLYPNHDFVFLFDQSSGHCKRAADGLQATSMNSGWGGKQPTMRATVIERDCLGDFPKTLNVGDTQTMVFGPEDDGPYYMKEHLRKERKNDVLKGKTVKAFNKGELMTELIGSGFHPRRGYTKKDLDEIAVSRGVPLQREIDLLDEGWEGKPKGALQVLFERGLIDSTKPLSTYSLAGKASWKDDNGDLLPQYAPFCLRHLLAECPDFKKEKSALQYLVEAYNTPTASFSILFTPKYHCEIAGEGIEYSWAFTKQVFRSIPYAEKRTSDGFRSCVRRSVAQCRVDNARKFSGRARRYMLAYLHYDANSSSPTFHDIEKYVRHTSKSHRNVADTETGFISEAMRTSISASA
jgi:hypothetical protein